MGFNSLTKSGPKASHVSQFHDKNDRLIVQDETRPNDWLRRYDRWRIPYCNRNRGKDLWLSFRRGDVDLFTLIYALILRVKGG